jgi:hypothetical protein
MMLVVYENLINSATLTASSEDVRYPLNNLKEMSTSDEWRSVTVTGPSVVTVVVALPAAPSSAVTIALIGNTYTGNTRFTSCLVEGHTSNSWTGAQTTIGTAVALPGKPIHELRAVAPFKFYRLSFSGDAPSIGCSNIILGQAKDVRCIDQSFAISYLDNSKVTRSRIGRKVIDEVTGRTRVVSGTVSVMDKAEFAVWEDMTSYCGISKPVYIAGEDFVANDTTILSGFFLFNKSGNFAHTGVGIWNTDFELEEVL